MSVSWESPIEAANQIGKAYFCISIVTEPQLLKLPEISKFVAELQRLSHVDVVYLTGEDVDYLARTARNLKCDAVVAIGGGSAIDRAKIARHLCLYPHDINTVGGSQRCGLKWLSSRNVSKIPLVAIPTTLGTGAEVSSSAVLLHKSKSVLVRGISMIPDSHYRIKGILHYLPKSILYSGVCEILFRVLAPFIESGKSEVPAHIIESTRKLINCGNAVLSCNSQADHLEMLLDEALEPAIQIGEETHTAEFHKGLCPFGSRGWYIANEIARYLGTTKMESLVPCWLAIISLCEEGVLSWCSNLMITEISNALPPEIRHPNLLMSLTELFSRWGMSTSINIAERDYSTLANSILWRWGWGLPMLNALDLPLVTEVLARAATGPYAKPQVKVQMRIERR